MSTADGSPKSKRGMQPPRMPILTRDVRQRFRVSAVQRRTNSSGESKAGTVADEEIVHVLTTMRSKFQDEFKREANLGLHPGSVISAALIDVKPGGSVLLTVRVSVRVAGNAVAAVGDLAGAVIVAVARVLEDALGPSVHVSAFSESTAAPGIPGEGVSGWGNVAPVLGAIATGIGVLGFVTFVGGLIVFARLEAAGFPAEPALGIFPSQDLVVIGAQTLIPQVVWGLAVVIAFVLLYALLRVAVKRVSHEEAALINGQATLLGAIGMFLFLALALVVGLLPWWDELSASQRRTAVIGIGVGAALAAAIASFTTRFLYLASTSFLLVAVFLGVVAFWRAGNEEHVRGAAVVRQNTKAVVGIFIAEGSGRVYLARVDMPGAEARNPRLVGITKSQITDIAIGPGKPQRDALVEADQLARELCELEPKAVAKAGQTREICRTKPAGEKQ